MPGINKVKNSPVVSVPSVSSAPEQKSQFDEFLRDHAPDFGRVLFVALIVYLIFRKGKKRGKEESDHEKEIQLSLHERELNELKEDFHHSISMVSRSFEELKSEFENAKLVPKGQALVSHRKESSTQYTTDDGYIMVIDVKYEHRAVAESILARELSPNEVVHHIYGPAKGNNLPGNLSVMDREQHEDFHNLLERKFKQDGRYPSTVDQKSILKRRYGAILLEEALVNKKVVYPPIVSNRVDFSAIDAQV
jgi:hypothetical protein